jgi:hypothetical protein
MRNKKYIKDANNVCLKFHDYPNPNTNPNTYPTKSTNYLFILNLFNLDFRSAQEQYKISMLKKLNI